MFYCVLTLNPPKLYEVATQTYSVTLLGMVCSLTHSLPDVKFFGIQLVIQLFCCL